MVISAQTLKSGHRSLNSQNQAYFGPDTIKYLQLLEQMFLKCEKELDDFSKLHALYTRLRPDIKCKCLLDKDDEQ